MARAKPNTIVGQFIPHRLEMIESAAWGALSLAARRILDRLECEHANHGGVENGNLPCTYADFERFGLRRKSIAGAIAELVALGFLEVTHQGRGGNAAYRNSSRYRLTYLSTKKAAPTDDWKNKTPGAKTPLVPGAKTPPTELVFGGENAPTASVAKTPLLSISREEPTPIPDVARVAVVAPPHVGRVSEGELAGGQSADPAPSNGSVASTELENSPILLAAAAEGVIPAVRRLLQGTPLEHADCFRAISGFSANDQMHSARRDLRECRARLKADPRAKRAG